MLNKDDIKKMRARKRMPADVRKAQNRAQQPFILKTRHMQLIIMPLIVMLAILAIIMIIIFI